MASTPPRWHLTGPGAVVLSSLLPLLAFLVAMALTDVWVDYKSLPLTGLLRSVPAYLGMVAVPAALALASARTGVLRLGVLVLMTGVAAWAGHTVIAMDDGQAGMAVFVVPYVAIPLAGALWLGRGVAAHWRRSGTSDLQASRPAAVPDRLAALVIDTLIVAGVLVAPLTAMSHAKHEIAAGVIGVALAMAYLGLSVAWRGATVGQGLLGLTVVDSETLVRVPLGRALGRGLVVAVEVAMLPTFVLAPPALAELVVAAANGRSLTDRLLRTSVVTTG